MLYSYKYKSKVNGNKNGLEIIIMIHCLSLFLLDVLGIPNSFFRSEIYIASSDNTQVKRLLRCSLTVSYISRETNYITWSRCSCNIHFNLLIMSHIARKLLLISSSTYIPASHYFPSLFRSSHSSFQRFVTVTLITFCFLFCQPYSFGIYLPCYWLHFHFRTTSFSTINTQLNNPLWETTQYMITLQRQCRFIPWTLTTINTMRYTQEQTRLLNWTALCAILMNLNATFWPSRLTVIGTTSAQNDHGVLQPWHNRGRCDLRCSHVQHTRQ